MISYREIRSYTSLSLYVLLSVTFRFQPYPIAFNSLNYWIATIDQFKCNKNRVQSIWLNSYYYERMIRFESFTIHIAHTNIQTHSEPSQMERARFGMIATSLLLHSLCFVSGGFAGGNEYHLQRSQIACCKLQQRKYKPQHWQQTIIYVYCDYLSLIWFEHLLPVLQAYHRIAIYYYVVVGICRKWLTNFE